MPLLPFFRRVWICSCRYLHCQCLRCCCLVFIDVVFIVAVFVVVVFIVVVFLSLSLLLSLCCCLFVVIVIVVIVSLSSRSAAPQKKLSPVHRKRVCVWATSLQLVMTLIKICQMSFVIRSFLLSPRAQSPRTMCSFLALATSWVLQSASYKDTGNYHHNV